MINYNKSQIYIIKNQDTDEVIFVGGTVSNLKRRYWNHKCNENDPFNKIARAQNLDWRHLRIQLIKDYDACRDRKTLKFAAETAYMYAMQDNAEILEHFLENLDYFIE